MECLMSFVNNNFPKNQKNEKHIKEFKIDNFPSTFSDELDGLGISEF